MTVPDVATWYPLVDGGAVLARPYVSADAKTSAADRINFVFILPERRERILRRSMDANDHWARDRSRRVDLSQASSKSCHGCLATVYGVQRNM